MSQKDYRRIAEELNFALHGIDLTDTDRNNNDTLAGFWIAVYAISAAMKKDNPSFDRDIFFAAIKK